MLKRPLSRIIRAVSIYFKSKIIKWLTESLLWKDFSMTACNKTMDFKVDISMNARFQAKDLIKFHFCSFPQVARAKIVDL